ncbi:hypothetical protein GCM10010428_79180 [Actinosynnema pretiosum subsp. pretiosum]
MSIGFFQEPSGESVLGQHLYRAVLQNPSARACLDVLARSPFQHCAGNSCFVEEVSQRESGGPRAHDPHHGFIALYGPFGVLIAHCLLLPLDSLCKDAHRR